MQELTIKLPEYMIKAMDLEGGAASFVEEWLSEDDQFLDTIAEICEKNNIPMD